MVFALSRQINKQKCATTINLLCADNEVFVKYQAQVNSNPEPPCVRPWPPDQEHCEWFKSLFGGLQSSINWIGEWLYRGD